MGVFLNILAALILFFVQAWIVPMVGLFTVSLLLLMPIHWLQRGMEPNEEYASEHPWRVHTVALAFTAAKIIAVLIEWSVVLLVLAWIVERFSLLNFTALSIVSFLIFLSALNNARTGGLSVFNSLSFRLKGGSSEMRYRHGQRDQPPDEILGPIVARRHGW